MTCPGRQKLYKENTGKHSKSKDSRNILENDFFPHVSRILVLFKSEAESVSIIKQFKAIMYESKIRF